MYMSCACTQSCSHFGLCVLQAAKNSSMVNGKPLIMKWYTPKPSPSPPSPYSHAPTVTPSPTALQPALPPSLPLSGPALSASTAASTDTQEQVGAHSLLYKYIVFLWFEAPLMWLTALVPFCIYQHLVFILRSALGGHTHSSHAHFNKTGPRGAAPCGG